MQPDELNSTQSAARGSFGLASLVALVVANMVGAGVFTTSGYSLAGLGSRQTVMWAWLVGGLVAMAGALSYGRLARSISQSGGEYLFLSRAVHPLAGFLAGWISLIAGFTGAIALAALTFEIYAVPQDIRPLWLPSGSVAMATIVAFGLIHSFIKLHGIVSQNVVVVIKLTLLLGFLIYSGWAFREGAWSGWTMEDEGRPFSWLAFGTALVWISLSYSGFNAAVYVAGEARHPKIWVPRAMWVATAVVTLLYLSLNIVFLYAAEPKAIAGEEPVARIAAIAIGGPTLAWLVNVVISLGMISSVSSMIIAGPRVYAQMANDGVLPRYMAFMPQSARQTPISAIWLQSLLACLIVLFYSRLENLLPYLGLTLSLSAAATVGSLFILHFNRSLEHRQSWVWLAIAAVFIVATMTLATLSAMDRPRQIVPTVITITSGVIVYGSIKFGNLMRRKTE
ncbi:MAG TPA: APC family permease [Pirellulaceae bacterium]|nr:APC family permease [Pirellulaceae bacterium]